MLATALCHCVQLLQLSLAFTSSVSLLFMLQSYRCDVYESLVTMLCTLPARGFDRLLVSLASRKCAQQMAEM
jgi:hypothetical protein